MDLNQKCGKWRQLKMHLKDHWNKFDLFVLLTCLLALIVFILGGKILSELSNVNTSLIQYTAKLLTCYNNSTLYWVRLTP